MDAYGALAEKLQNVEMLTKVMETYEDEEEDTNWYDEYKQIEQAFMVLMDEYAQVAEALGCDCNTFWGDPKESHEEVVEFARMLRKRYIDDV